MSTPDVIRLASGVRPIVQPRSAVYQVESCARLTSPKPDDMAPRGKYVTRR